MATGTSGDKRDDALTDATSEVVDAETTDETETVDAAAEGADVEESEADSDGSTAGDAVAAGAASKTVVKDKREKQGKTLKRSEAEAAKKNAAKQNPLARFFGEVMAEIKKVVTPTRKELWRYVLVVICFLIIVMGLVALFDFVFNFLASWTFGVGEQLFSLPIEQSVETIPSI